MMFHENPTLNNVSMLNDRNLHNKPVSDLDRFLKQEGMDPLYIHSTIEKKDHLSYPAKSVISALNRMIRRKAAVKEARIQNPMKDNA